MVKNNNKMKNNRSFINIQKLLDSGNLDAICWVMIVFDTKMSDMVQLSVNIKAKVRHKGKIKSAFFHDCMLNFEGDFDYLKDIFLLTQKIHPESEDKISFVIKKLDEWKLFNKGVVSPDTSPIMFSSDIA